MMLGNLTINQIENELGIEFTDEHKKLLTETHQDKVNIPLEKGKWHCFYLPFYFVCSDKEMAEQWVEIFKSYDVSKFKTQIGIAWER